MKIELWTVGNPSPKHLQNAEGEYINRTNTMVQFSMRILRTNKIKSRNAQEIKKLEGQLILEKLKDRHAQLILLDVRGKEYDTNQFTDYISHQLNHSPKDLIFLIGGSYGFDINILNHANHKISLSKLTFPHQLVRLIFLEQIYRAFSIINHLPYHHQ